MGKIEEVQEFLREGNYFIKTKVKNLFRRGFLLY